MRSERYPGTDGGEPSRPQRTLAVVLRVRTAIEF